MISNVANTTRKQNWTQGNHFEHKNLKEVASKGNLLKSHSLLTTLRKLIFPLLNCFTAQCKVNTCVVICDSMKAANNFHATETTMTTTMNFFRSKLHSPRKSVNLKFLWGPVHQFQVPKKQTPTMIKYEQIKRKTAERSTTYRHGVMKRNCIVIFWNGHQSDCCILELSTQFWFQVIREVLCKTFRRKRRHHA